MTTESDTQGGIVPFLVRRSESMSQPPRFRLRYDTQRQITQVDVGGRWIDAPDVADGSNSGTRRTRVQAETTDDE